MTDKANIISPFFSIIIPIYNKEDYIDKCIDSIINQTFSNFEVVIINDGSTDNSSNKLNDITDSRFKVISISNGGVSNARNIGISESTGQYIIFIDADDYIATEYLSTIHQALQQYQVDLLIFGLSKVFENNNIVKLIPHKTGHISHQEFIDSYMSEFERLDGIYGFVCNKAIKRSLIVDHKLSFNTLIKQAEDLDFWLSIYAFKPTMAFLQYADYFYIQNAVNSSAFFDFNAWPLISIWIKMYNYLSPCNKSNESLIRKKIWGFFEAIFWECEYITIPNIKAELDKIDIARKEYNFLNDYTPNNFLRKQIKKRRVFSIFVYLKIRRAYHNLRKWLK